MVVLVPRQLQMTGMTGAVPYFGGRFTPAQAYAASHPTQPPGPPRRRLEDALAALDRLLETEIIDQQEYEQLRARIGR